MNLIKGISLGILVLALSACGTSDAELREQGFSEAYIEGFHDGEHSGITEEGNRWDHYVRDEDRFENDPDYRAGWLAGEAEGREEEKQAEAVRSAVGLGVAIESASHSGGDPDETAQDVIDHTDTSGMEALGQ